MLLHRQVLSVVLLSLLTPGTVMASLLNPGFEEQTDGLMPNGVSTGRYVEWGLPDDWDWRNSGATNALGIRYDYKPFDTQVGWSSEGDWSLYMFASTAGSHRAGDFLEFYQTVDLTGQQFLHFDAYLRGGDYTNTYIAIDGQRLWTERLAGTYSDTPLYIGAFQGVHEVQLGVQVFQPFGDSADAWSYFDNLRLVPVPGTQLLLLLGWLALVLRLPAEQGG